MKYFICVLLLAVAAITVSAYDFRDSDFNEFIFEDLKDLTETRNTFVAARSRRETETPPETASSDRECKKDWKKDIQCCQGDKFNHEQLEKYKDVQKQCSTELHASSDDFSFDPFDCEKMLKVKDQLVCISECVSKKLGVIGEDGELNRETIIQQVRTKIGDVAWKADVVESFVDKCLAEVKAAKSTTDAKEGSCKHQSIDFHHCIWREFLNGCPADLRVDTPKCNKIRERISHNDTGFLNKRLLHHFHHSIRQEE